MKSSFINNVIFDVDGVLTDGTFFYSVEGKILKRFGSHDAQAIRICKDFFNIHLISADQKGFEISKLRAKHLELPITLVSEKLRSEWIKKNFIRDETALVVDSFTDIPSLENVIKSFAPSNAHPELLNRVSNKLISSGGGGVVAEVLDILLYEKIKKHLWDML
jgi:3-deoxy-D-manno-octulosonate 8-phosphate phosphatase (KDO 8-P phosphatase)